MILPPIATKLYCHRAGSHASLVIHAASYVAIAMSPVKRRDCARPMVSVNFSAVDVRMFLARET